MSNTPEGARKGVETLRKKRGQQYLIDRARRAGRASAAAKQQHSFAADPAYASAMGKKGMAVRWGKK